MLLTEWTLEDEFAVHREEGREEEREYVLELLDQGVSIDELRKHLGHMVPGTKNQRLKL
jgi:hypothetical protein